MRFINWIKALYNKSRMEEDAYNEFFNNRDWPVASALAIVMLLLLLVPIVLFHRFQAREMEKHG